MILSGVGGPDFLRPTAMPKTTCEGLTGYGGVGVSLPTRIETKSGAIAAYSYVSFGLPALSTPHIVQSEIELQHVDSRFAENA